MHGRMPVVTTVESRRQFPRRGDAGVANQDVTDLVRILFPDTGQSEIRETFRCWSIELRRNIIRHCPCSREQKKNRDQRLPHRRNVTQSAPRQTGLTPRGEIRHSGGRSRTRFGKSQLTPLLKKLMPFSSLAPAWRFSPLLLPP